MDFRILGPLEVFDGDRPLALGGTKQRALLALLLLHANEVVSRDRLIEELWGERAARGRREGTSGSGVAAAANARARPVLGPTQRFAGDAAARAMSCGSSAASSISSASKITAGRRPGGPSRGRPNARRGQAQGCSRTVARRAARRPRLRVVRQGRDRPLGRTSRRSARGPDRGGSRSSAAMRSWWRSSEELVAAPSRCASVSASELMLALYRSRTPSGRARGLPERSPGPDRRARDRAGPRAARAPGGDPAPGSQPRPATGARGGARVAPERVRGPRGRAG